MTIIINSGIDFDLETYRRLAWGGEDLEFTPQCLRQIKAWREEFLETMAAHQGEPIYGVNVGAGDGSFNRLDANTETSYLNGLNSATSFGRPLPERVVRGMIFARLASFVDGSSAVTPALTQHIAEMLRKPLPEVPAEGTGGSGEILPLGHLFHAVPSELSLGPKESMSLINGAPCAGALVSDTAIRARALVSVLELSFALACDALNVPDGHFDQSLGSTWGFPAEASALRRMRELLCNPSKKRNNHQARVSVRILPRVLAAAYEAVAAAESAAASAIRGPGDNPIFVSASREEGPARIISNGSFHNHSAIIAIDGVGRALADLTQLSQHFIHALYQDKTAMPDQDNLALGAAYMAAADWSEEARLHAAPSILSFAAVGQNDVTNPLFAAWRSANRIEECLLAQMAILSTMASQSLHATHRQTTRSLAGYLTLVRETVQPIDARRDIGFEIGHLMKRLREEQEATCTSASSIKTPADA
ncbi:histidine ammonia-lyase [Arthrobacter bambusae]|uniref:Histidine ammonia-lyase n=1 Tax=Arthrobacter bambusae TaxID=1338426 RepID=A0ABV2P1F3_9MICC